MGFDYNALSQATNLLSSFNGQTKRKIITVNGIKEAQDFKLSYGESVLFLDSNEDLLYVKQCDDIGKINLRVYQCIDCTQQYEEQTPSPICKADLDKFQNTILDEVKKLIGGQNEFNVKSK